MHTQHHDYVKKIKKKQEQLFQWPYYRIKLNGGIKTVTRIAFWSIYSK